MHYLDLLKNRVIQIALAVWVIIGFIVLSNIPFDRFCHDFWAHIEYTKILVNQHRLPKAGEGFETHQQPLFYLIASLIAPKALDINLEFHANCVRVISLLFGSFSIIVIAWILNEFTKNKWIQLLVLLFIETTPKFVLIFSTYNNDSLVTFFSILMVALAYKFYTENNNLYLKLLSVTTILALYSKLSVLLTISCLIVLCILQIIFQKETKINLKSKEIKIIMILLLSLLSIIPVAINNHKNTGVYFPSLDIQGLAYELKFKPEKTFVTIFTPLSLLSDFKDKWSDPLVHPWPHQSSKKDDYWAFNYLTSAYGEFDFQSPNKLILWIILLTHLFMYIVSLTKLFKSSPGRFMGLLILSAHLFQIAHVIKNPFSCNMDFRFISWTYLPWAVLFVNALEAKNSWYSKHLGKIMLLGIISDLYFLITVY